MKVHDKDYTGKNLAELAAQVFNKQVDTAVITSIPAQEGSGLVNHSPPPSSKNQKEMIDPKSLRIGNTVTIENPKYWPELKGIPMTVIGYNATNDSGWPKSTASISVVDFNEHPIMYHQFNEFISGIPLSEQELIRLGFEKPNPKAMLYVRTAESSKGKLLALVLSQCGNGSYSPTAYTERHEEIWHVHHLQNLFYDLTGTELTYKVENETVKP